MKLGFFSVSCVIGLIVQIDLNHGLPGHIHGFYKEADSSKNVICVGSPIIGSTRAYELIQLRRYPDVHPNEKNAVICVQSQVLESNIQHMIEELLGIQKVLDAKASGQLKGRNLEKTDTLQMVADLFNDDCVKSVLDRLIAVRNKIHEKHSGHRGGPNSETAYPLQNMEDLFNNDYVQIALDQLHTVRRVLDSKTTGQQYAPSIKMTEAPQSGALKNVADLFNNDYGAFNQEFNASVEHEINQLPPSCEQEFPTEASHQQIELITDTDDPKRLIAELFTLIYNQLLEVRRLIEARELQNHNPEPGFFNSLQFVIDQLLEMWRALEKLALGQLQENNSEPTDMTANIVDLLQIVYDQLHEVYRVIEATTSEQQRGLGRQPVNNSETMDLIRSIWKPFTIIYDKLYEAFMILDPKKPDRLQVTKSQPTVAIRNITDVFKHVSDRLSEVWSILEAKDQNQPAGYNLGTNDSLQTLEDLFKKDYDQVLDFWRDFESKESGEPGGLYLESTDALQTLVDLLKKDYEKLLEVWRLLDQKESCEPGLTDSESSEKLQDISDSLKIDYDQLVKVWNLIQKQQQSEENETEPAGPLQDIASGFKMNFDRLIDDGSVLDEQKSELQKENRLEACDSGLNIPDLLTNIYDQLPAVCRMLESQEPYQAGGYDPGALNSLFTQFNNIWRVIEANLQHHLEKNNLTVNDMIRNLAELIKTLYDRLPEVWKILSSKAPGQVDRNLGTNDSLSSPESILPESILPESTLPESIPTNEPEEETSGSSIEELIEGSDDDDMPTQSPPPPVEEEVANTEWNDSLSSPESILPESILPESTLPESIPTNEPEEETSGSSIEELIEGSDDDDMPTQSPSPPVEEEVANTEWTDTLHMIAFLFKIDYDQLRAVWTVLEQKAPEQLNGDGSETTDMLQTIAKLFNINYDQLLVVWRVLESTSSNGSDLDTNETLHMIANVFKEDYELQVEGSDDDTPPVEEEEETNTELIDTLHMVAFLFKIDYEKLHSIWKVIEAKVPDELKGDRSQVAANLRMTAKMFKINYEQLLAVWRVLETKAPEGTISDTTHSLHMIAEVFKIGYDDLLEVWRLLDAMETFEQGPTDSDMTARLQTIAGLFQIDYNKLLDVWSVLQAESQTEEMDAETNGTIGMIDEIYNIEAELITDIPLEQLLGPRSIPYRAVIFATDWYSFIGSLVSLNSVLTSAYCVKYSKSWIVGLGSVAYNDEADQYEYYQKSDVGIPHPYYDSELHLNDIAIIKLPNPVTFSINIQVINLPTFADIKVNIAHKDAIVIGVQSQVLNNAIVNATIVHTISNTECAEIVSKELVTNAVLCTMGRSDSQPLINENGDSLVLHKDDGSFTLVGIFSSGEPPVAYGNHRFTRVTSFLGWLEEVSDINIKC